MHKRNSIYQSCFFLLLVSPFMANKVVSTGTLILCTCLYATQAEDTNVKIQNSNLRFWLLIKEENGLLQF